MKTRLVVAALVATASPLFAQAAQQAKDPDPTHKASGGISAAGWMGRVDPQAAARGMSLDNARFAPMAGGFHVTSGPAAIYYNPANAAKGNFTVSASFTQTKAPSHPEAYGLFAGGRNLQDSTESYMYFLVRGDGKYLINHRAGNDVHKIVEWTENAAVKKQDDAGKATNELAIKVSADSVHFLANGTQVKAFAKSELHGFNLDGQTGIRVNHNLDVHVAGYAVKSGK